MGRIYDRLTVLSRHLPFYKNRPNTSLVFTRLAKLKRTLFNLNETPIFYFHKSTISKRVNESTLEKLLPINYRETVFIIL